MSCPIYFDLNCLKKYINNSRKRAFNSLVAAFDCLCIDTQSEKVFITNGGHPLRMLIEPCSEKCNLIKIANDEQRDFFCSVKIPVNLLNFLTENIKEDTYNDDNLRSKKLRLPIVLTYLMTGISLKALVYIFKVSWNWLKKIIPETCDSICNLLEDNIKMPQNEIEWNQTEKEFCDKWQLPGCCGVIGEKIISTMPSTNAESFFDKSFNILLLAIVDNNHFFRYIDIECNSKNVENNILCGSEIFTSLENNIMPSDMFLLGNDKFPLNPYLLSSFPDSNLTADQKKFNTRVSKMEKILDETFESLTAKFKILQRPILLFPEKNVKTIVKTCCILYNWLETTANNEPDPITALA